MLNLRRKVHIKDIKNYNPEHKNTNSQKYKFTKIQIHKNKNSQKYKYTKIQIHKHTNTAYDEVPERPHMCHIFEKKRIVQGYQNFIPIQYKLEQLSFAQLYEV